MTTSKPKKHWNRTKEQIAEQNARKYAKDKKDPAKLAARLASNKASKARIRAPIKAANAAAKLSREQAALQAELASRALARRRLLHFITRLDPKYMAGWVHSDICRRLERFSAAVAAGLSPRLMLLMPPRAGKSRIASISFPAWHLGSYPDHEIIASSYNVGLAMTFSKKVKALLEDSAYRILFPNSLLDPNNQSAESWTLAGQSGGYVAAGVGGGITGKGAHILIIDDPVKNAEEADSAVTREAIREWFGSTAYTRLAPGGGVLIIQTCWHDDDLAGWLQNVMRADEEADQYEVVKYPAIAEFDEYLDPSTDEIIRVAPKDDTDVSAFTPLRKKGEALHEARYDIIKLNRIKKTLSPRFWSALYQQNPVPDDGTYFVREHFRRGGLPQVRNANVYIAWDFAISEKQTNDYTVGVVALQDKDDVLHFADMVRFKSGDSFFIVDAIIALARKWKSPTLKMGFEDGQIFRAMQTLLKKRMKEEGLFVPYEVLKPVTDKMVRARPLQGRMQQGMVSYATDAEWFNTAQQEMLRFPAGVHDDTVDAQAWAAQMVLGAQPPREIVPKGLKSWREKLRVTRTSGGHLTA